MLLDLNGDEKLELIELLAETIAREHHEASPRAALWQTILDKLEAEDSATPQVRPEAVQFVHAAATLWKREIEAEDRQTRVREEMQPRGGISRTLILAMVAAIGAVLLLLFLMRR
jgi:hypothetical protein